MTVKDLFDFVFCCLSQDQQHQIEIAFKNNKPAAIYQAQENLVKEKYAYRCQKCGKTYPFLQLVNNDMLLDPKSFAKPTGTLYKVKKAAVLFCNSHYYVPNKKTLIKFELDSNQTSNQTDSIPIIGGVYHTKMSPDEHYIATETFGGTIQIIDTHSKLPIAKKQRTKVNGAFIFTHDHKLLYFFEDAIHCWDFLAHGDATVWTISEQRKKDYGYPKTVCSNILYNSSAQSYIFEFNGIVSTYVVAIKDMALQQEWLLPAAPTWSKLVYSSEQKQYTLSEKDYLVIYDLDFNIVEKFTPPHMISISDGNGQFPVTRHVSQHPHRTFLSPDGKWLLLDYFNYVILMRREDLDIKFCLFSYKGGTTRYMGFVDNDHIWYTWGDTTYIQQIK